MHSLNKNRIIKTISAHVYGQALNFLIAIFIPSVLVRNWGVDGFGYWVTLLAVSQFFVISDLNVSVAMANQLCMKSDRDVLGARLLVNKTLSVLFKKINITLSFIFFISIISYFYFFVKYNSNQALLFSFSFMALASAFAFQPFLNVYMSIWRYLERNEVGIFLVNTTRLIELCLLIAASQMGFGLIFCSMTILLFKLITVIAILNHSKMLLKKEGTYLKNFVLNDQTSNEVKMIKKASGGFTLISLSQQIMLNTPVIIISALLGSIPAAVFAASRTLSRVSLLPLSMILISLNPEMTILAAQKNYKGLRHVVFVFSIVSFLSISLVNVGILEFHESIENLWFKGKLILDYSTLLVLCITSAVLSISQILSQSMSAINNTRRQGKLYLMIYLSMALVIYSSVFYTKNILWVSFFSLLSEMIILIFLFLEYRKNYLLNYS